MEAEKKAFKITKREIGFVLGIVVFLLVKFLPLAELSSTVELTVGGQTCLALTLATVVFWACGVAQPGFVGLLYCALLQSANEACNIIGRHGCREHLGDGRLYV